MRDGAPIETVSRRSDEVALSYYEIQGPIGPGVKSTLWIATVEEGETL